MNTILYDKNGKKTTKNVKLDESIFGLKINEELITHAVYAYLQNQRQSNAQTKDRSQVSGGGKKPWKQKGTGRARHGSSRSPIWKGGGVTFGPTNDVNYKVKINKKANQKAIRNAFSFKNSAKDIIVIDDFKVEKTKEVEAILKNLGIEGKVTFIQVEDDGLNKAVKNIKNAKAVRTGELNIFSILDNKKLVITKNSLEDITKKWGKSEVK